MVVAIYICELKGYVAYLILL